VSLVEKKCIPLDKFICEARVYPPLPETTALVVSVSVEDTEPESFQKVRRGFVHIILYWSVGLVPENSEAKWFFNFLLWIAQLEIRHWLQLSILLDFLSPA
jgi:hypothetical protein